MPLFTRKHLESNVNTWKDNKQLESITMLRRDTFIFRHAVSFKYDNVIQEIIQLS